MQVREYLQSKYKVDAPSTMMACEARIFGIPYPLQTGWMAAYGGIEITPQMISRLAASLSVKKAPMAADGLRVIGMTATPAQVGAYSRKAAKKQRKKEAKAAKVLALQIKLADTSRKPVYTEPTPKKKKAPAAPLTVEGVDVRSKEFLQTWTWRELRYKTLQRYGRACLCCGASPQTGAVIHVDHIKPRSLFPELAMDPDNLQTLCADCNVGKSNKDMTDWREPEPDAEQIDHLRSIMAAS